MYLLKDRHLKSFLLIASLIFSMLLSGCSSSDEQYVVSDEGKPQQESAVETDEPQGESLGDSDQSSASQPNSDSKAANRYSVLRVVDGDTIIVNIDGNAEKVRMIGIDTPESVHPDKSKNTPEGKIASEFTKSQLEGQNVQLEFDVQERDKYGRLLAYVWINNVMFNKTLLSQGYAKVATFPPNVRYVDDFKALEKQARELKKGFWGEVLSAPSSSGNTSSSSSSPSATSQAVYSYVGNSNSMKFHNADCEWAQKISPANRITFSQRQDAINSGYVPCKVCNP